MVRLERFCSVVLAWTCLLATLLGWGPMLGADATAGDSCAAVLSAGIYNTYLLRNFSSSYDAFHASMCQFDSSYTYSQYLLDTSTTTGSSSSNAANGNVCVLNVVCLGGGGSGSGSRMTETQFTQYMESVIAYQHSQCGSSSVESSQDSAVTVLSKVVSPEVIQAYVACLQLYVGGVHIQQTNGLRGNSLTLDILFEPAGPHSTAEISGLVMYPKGAADCQLLGETILRWRRRNFTHVALSPLVSYSVFCALTPKALAAPDLDRVDINIFTSIGGTYHALLYRTPEPTQVEILQSSVASLRAALSALSARTDAQAAGLVQLTADLAQLSAAVNAQSQTLPVLQAALNAQAQQLQPMSSYLTPLLQTGTRSHCVLRRGGGCPDGWTAGYTSLQVWDDGYCTKVGAGDAGFCTEQGYPAQGQFGGGAHQPYVQWLHFCCYGQAVDKWDPH